MRFVKWGAISVVGIVILLFLIGISNRPPSGAEPNTPPAPYQAAVGLAGPTAGEQLSERIKKACRDEYGVQGEDEVSKCVFRHEVKAMDQIQADHEGSVDARIGR